MHRVFKHPYGASMNLAGHVAEQAEGHVPEEVAELLAGQVAEHLEAAVAGNGASAAHGPVAAHGAAGVRAAACAGSFCALRAFLRSLGLAEEAAGTSFLYYSSASGSPRQFATLSGGDRRATVYLYPDALGRAAGCASDLYDSLDRAGFDLGSKAGPSIGIDVADPAMLRLFEVGLAIVVTGVTSTTRVTATSAAAPRG